MARATKDPAAAVWVPCDTLQPWPGNPRKNDGSPVDAVAASLIRFGWGSPIVAQKSGTIVAGHTRWKAARALAKRWDSATKDERKKWHPEAERTAKDGLVPVRYVDLPDHEAHLLAVADNKVGELARWDDDLLAEVLAMYDEPDFEVAGFTQRELDALIGESRGGSDPGPSSKPLPAVSQAGDVWVCGSHRVMCGDSTSAGDMAELMDGEPAELMHADPPYGMAKETVENDHLRGSNLDEFQMLWWRTARAHMVDNASAYIWGNAPDLWRLWYGHLERSERLAFRNEIVWDKGIASGGMGSDDMRSFAGATERCLFFMLGDQGFSTNADSYWEGWEPIRSYLHAEVQKMGWGAKDVKRICGVGMYSHWFSKSQWVMIPEAHYLKLQAAAEGKAFNRPYTETRGDWQSLLDGHREQRAAFYATRPHFDNTHEIMTDVWQYGRVTGGERHGHETPKPVEMVSRILRSSARAGGVVLEPFGGTGTTLIAAELTGRACRVMEITPAWVDVIVDRWQRLTGERARCVTRDVRIESE